MHVQRTVQAVIRPGEESGYVAECVEIPVVTQGATLDEVVANLNEAVALYFDGEDLTVASTPLDLSQRGGWPIAITITGHHEAGLHSQ